MNKLKKNIAISETGFLFNPSSGDSFILNDSALEIIRQMHLGKSMDEIKKYFTEKYDVEESAFERYCIDFISMLKYYQLIEEDGKE